MVRLKRDMLDVWVIAVAIGTLTSGIGAYVSFFLDGATGGIIVVLQTAIFLVAFFFAPNEFGRPYFGPPEMPAENLKILRRAFDATMADNILRFRLGDDSTAVRWTDCAPCGRATATCAA